MTEKRGYVPIHLRRGRRTITNRKDHSRLEILEKQVVRTLKLKKGLFFEFNAPVIRKDELSIF